MATPVPVATTVPVPVARRCRCRWLDGADAGGCDDVDAGGYDGVGAGGSTVPVPMPMLAKRRCRSWCNNAAADAEPQNTPRRAPCQAKNPRFNWKCQSFLFAFARR